MKVNLFTKEQLLNGYLRTSNPAKLVNTWLASVIYHGLDILHEDMLFEEGYTFFSPNGMMCQTDGLSTIEDMYRELSLWDLVD